MASPQSDAGSVSFGEEFTALVTLLSQQRLATYINLAATTFYVWDMILTMDDEIIYIWGSPMSTVKIFYLLNRYIRLVVVVGNTVLGAWPTPYREMCIALPILGLAGGIVLSFLIGVIMQIRLYALYNRNTKLIACVALLFTVQMIALVVLSALEEVAATGAPQKVGNILGVPFCLIPLSSTYFAISIPTLLFDFIVLVLACYNLVQRYRLSPPTSQGAQNGQQLVRVLLWDSIWYFSVCFAVTLGFVVASRYGPIELAALTSALCVVAIGAGASRLLVNTRKVVRVGENHISD